MGNDCPGPRNSDAPALTHPTPNYLPSVQGAPILRDSIFSHLASHRRKTRSSGNWNQLWKTLLQSNLVEALALGMAWNFHQNHRHRPKTSKSLLPGQWAQYRLKPNPADFAETCALRVNRHLQVIRLHWFKSRELCAQTIMPNDCKSLQTSDLA